MLHEISALIEELERLALTVIQENSDESGNGYLWLSRGDLEDALLTKAEEDYLLRLDPVAILKLLQALKRQQ